MNIFIEDEPVRPSIVQELAAGTVYIAHLGSSLRYPEETNIAYAGTAADGVVCVEQDVRLNADGSLVNSHDATVAYVSTSASSVSALTDAAVAALTVDASVWFGVDYPTAEVTLFRDVAWAYRSNFVFFPETKDSSGTQTVAELQAAGIRGTQAVVSSFTVGDLAAATAAGYKTMLASTGADILATAVANSIDYVVYDKGSASSRFTAAVSAGKPPFAYTVDRRSERDYLTGLGVVGMYSNDPVYLAANTPFATTDAFASQDWMVGMVPNKAANQSRPTATERGRFFASDYWGFADSGVTTYQGVLQGWACPVGGDPDADDYQVDFKVTFGAPSDADQARHANVFISNTDTEFMDVGVGNTSPNGYSLVMRKNGTMQIYRIDAPNTATLLVENTDGAAISDNAEHRFIIKVTPTKIRIERLDGSGNIVQHVTTGDTTAGHRGGYVHFGHSRLPVKFRDITFGAVAVDYWHPFDDAVLPDIFYGPDSPQTLASGVISQLDDISANGWDATQSTAGERPTPVAAGIGTHRVADYDGGDDMNLPAGALGLFNAKGGAYGHVVYNHETTDGAGADRILFSFANNATASRFAMFAGSAAGANRASVGGRRADSDSFFSASSATARSSQNVMAGGMLDYPNRTVTLWIHGVQDAQTTSAFTAGSTSSATNSTRARLGAGIGVSPAGFQNGKTGLVLIYDQTINSTLRQKIEGWAAHDFGLAGSLDGAHPYKSTPPIN